MLRRPRAGLRTLTALALLTAAAVTVAPGYLDDRAVPGNSTPPAGHGYRTYEGAYGQTGEASQAAYLDRTAYWVGRFREVSGD